MRLKCHIVKDLFPNYIEHLTSEETNKEIMSHLEQCPQCTNVYSAMNMPIPEIKIEELNKNKRELTYLKKCTNILRNAFIIIGVLILTIAVILFSCIMIYKNPDKEMVTDISQYSKYLGSSGKYSDRLLVKNSIFPNSIPPSAKIEDFCYYYYNPWDPNYLAYLVYTCSKEDYVAEVKRLSSIKSSDERLIYSSKGFNYPVCAVIADSTYGYIYALADEENNRLIYVEITFCNYFSDIEYEKFINKKYLPIGFNAKKDNPVRKDFDTKHGIK